MARIFQLPVDLHVAGITLSLRTPPAELTPCFLGHGTLSVYPYFGFLASSGANYSEGP
jgi:hypothetical protein